MKIEIELENVENELVYTFQNATAPPATDKN